MNVLSTKARTTRKQLKLFLSSTAQKMKISATFLKDQRNYELLQNMIMLTKMNCKIRQGRIKSLMMFLLHTYQLVRATKGNKRSNKENPPAQNAEKSLILMLWQTCASQQISKAANMKPNTACSFTIFKISSPLEGFTKGFNGAKNTLLYYYYYYKQYTELTMYSYVNK